MPDEDATPTTPAALILVVDDNRDTRTMYSLYLRHHGFLVVEAVNGVEAVEQAYSHQPVLIVMDLGMPHLDGWEATRRIKANPRTQHIPVLAITGYAVTEAERRAQEAGVDRYCLKPGPAPIMLEKIEAMLSPSGPSCDAKARAAA